MNNMPITFSIPLDLPNIDLMFWLRPYTTDTLSKRYRINYPYASLYLQKIVPYNNRKLMDPNMQSMLSFAISEYNINDIKEVFLEVSLWFKKENKKLLYGVSDDGVLMFNSDYQKLNASYVSEYNRIKTALKVVPTVVEVGNQVMEPGVIIYINMQENAIVLREYQIKRLCKFIETFNFITYIQFAMQCFQHSIVTGSLISNEEIQKRLNAQRQYNTNFNF